MTRSPRMVLVMYLDPNDVPRAWARGPRSKLDDVRTLAKRHLDKYKAEKREVGDTYLAEAEYREQVKGCR